MKLYSFFRSSAAYRVRIALNVKGLSYDYVAKHLLKNGGEHRLAEYLAINPQGFIPALEHDGVLITQSLAIIEYLDEVFPTPPLLPTRAIDRAHVRAMALVIACDIHPLNNLRVLNYLKSPLEQDSDTTAVWYRHWIAEGFSALEQMIAKHSTANRHCFGDTVTIADVLLVPQVVNARRFELDLKAYPNLLQTTTYLESLPAFVQARPDMQPDAE
ncbi:MAG: maleylacetoacetate isomerase [Candidatus Obscuribacterales bacterium]|nr:maleylacetoacetate isomerase [Steroidobacteraceae bacterium]